jgi:hypothetical protein
MGNAKYSAFGMVVLAAVYVAACPSPCSLACATRQGSIKPIVTDGSVAFYISPCLWFPEPSPTCWDVPLAPGAAGHAFVRPSASPLWPVMAIELMGCVAARSRAVP